MIILLAQYTVQDGRAADVIPLMKTMSEQVKAHEPGCLQYDLSQSAENPHQFLIYEKYADTAALAAHRETPHFKEIILGQVVPLLAERAVAFYQPVVTL